MGDEESPKPAESERSLGDQSTFGDAGSSVSDVVGLDNVLDSDMEVVDLSSRYEIEGVLGKGGMGEVLRARDKRLHRPVAIKRVLGQMARSKKALTRFLTEAVQGPHSGVMRCITTGLARTRSGAGSWSPFTQSDVRGPARR